MSHFVWTTLGIEPTLDIRSIKRAYAQRLKQKRPEDDADAFQRLRHAYEWALHWAEQQQSGSETGEPANDTNERATALPEPAPTPKETAEQLAAGTGAISQQTAQQKLIQERLLPLKLALNQGETAAIAMLDDTLSAAATSFVERDMLEIELMLLLANCSPIPPRLALHAAKAFDWFSPASQRLLQRHHPEAAAAVLSLVFAERDREQWQTACETDATTRSAFECLLTEQSRWRRLQAKLEHPLHRRIDDLLYLIPQETPHYWQRIHEMPSVRWWQENNQPPPVSANQLLLVLVLGLLSFFALRHQQAGLGWGIAGFAGGSVIALATIWWLNVLDRHCAQRPTVRIGAVAALLLAQSISMVVLIINPVYSNYGALLSFPLWWLTVIALDQWPRLWRSFVQSKGLSALLFLWILGIFASAKIEQGAFLIAVFLNGWGIFMLTLAIRTANTDEDSEVDARQMFQAGSRLLAIFLGLYLFNFRDSVWAPAILGVATLMIAAAWQTPRFRGETVVRIVSLLVAYIALSRLLAQLLDIRDVGRYILITILVLLIVNAAQELVFRLIQRWQPNRI